MGEERNGGGRKGGGKGLRVEKEEKGGEMVEERWGSSHTNSKPQASGEAALC